MVDYSKWSKIEISDDEEDTHPNIDTPSLFRWRHQARLERMAKFDMKVQEFENRKKECIATATELYKKLTSAKQQGLSEPEVTVLQQKYDETQAQLKELEQEEAAINKERKSQPLNVDTISKPGFSKSVINKKTEPPKKDEETIAKNMKTFVELHKKEVKQYGMLSSLADSGQYLLDHPYCACEEAANYLCLWCIDLAVEDKIALMERVARQTVCLQFLLELATAQKCSPQSLVKSFFIRLAKMDGEYADGFKNELAAFKQRVRDRAEARIAEAMQKVEEEERQKRLGPGGLDPVEVFESLPPNLKECFEKKNIEMLKEVSTQIPPEEMEYHLKRCVDSGLWIPNEDADDSEACHQDNPSLQEQQQQEECTEASEQQQQP